MKRVVAIWLIAFLLLGINGYSVAEEEPMQAYTADTQIRDVISDPVFDGYGRLIFPVDEWYYSGDTLGNLGLTYYSHIDPDTTVEICNYPRTHADTVFFDIYTEEEKAADPEKANTGLFFFKGEPGARFAICNAGGAFAFVGAMHDSFPHALELSRQGYNKGCRHVPDQSRSGYSS